MSKGKVHILRGNQDPLVVGNKVFKSFNDWELTEKEKEKARIELGETEERRKKCLQELKRRLSKEGNYRTDDDFLLRYLRVRKFDCDKAYKNVKYLYEMRKNPDFFGDPSNLRSSGLHEFISNLPYTDEEGRILFWLDLAKWNPQEISTEEAAQHLTTIYEITSMNPKCQVNGAIGVWDVKELNATHIAALLKKKRFITMINISLSAFPWRVGKFVIMNTSRLVRILYNVARPFLSRKIVQRVFLLGSDLNELHQHINPLLLPKKLGGGLEDKECNALPWIKENIPYIEYERSFTGN